MANEGQPRLGRYLMEVMPDETGFDDIRALTERSRAACAEMTSQNVVVRLIRSVFMPEDGTCLLLFDASSAPAVAEAGRRAALHMTSLSIVLAMPNALTAVQ
jgi:hypothetical protein